MRHYGAWQRPPPWDHAESARKVSAGIAPCPAMERILGCVGVQVNQLHAALSMHTADAFTVTACVIRRKRSIVQVWRYFRATPESTSADPVGVCCFLALVQLPVSSLQQFRRGPPVLRIDADSNAHAESGLFPVIT